MAREPGIGKGMASSPKDALNTQYLASLCILFGMVTLPETNSSPPENRRNPKRRRIVFQPSMFSFYYVMLVSGMVKR